jgi:CRP/FNR family transcriptional regulator, cyclic AMP receptor protein
MTASGGPTHNLLAAVPEHLTTLLFANAVSVRLMADEVLFLAGDPGNGCYRVEHGLLKVGIASAAGSERILAIVGAGAIVGELSVIDGKPRSASVTAVRESRLGFVSKEAFEAVADRHPELYKFMLQMLATRLRDANAVVAAGSFLPLSGRVARCLLDLAAAFGESVGGGRIVIRHKIGQSDLAAMAGIARENLSRVLNDWTRRKLITRLSGYYCLEDKAQLERELD